MSLGVVVVGEEFDVADLGTVRHVLAYAKASVVVADRDDA